MNEPLLTLCHILTPVLMASTRKISFAEIGSRPSLAAMKFGGGKTGRGACQFLGSQTRPSH